MAHYKLNRPRTATHVRGSNRRGYGIRHWPRWHDIVFHTRPRRRRETELLTAVLHGRDPDRIAWPMSKKPHKYYF